MPAPNLPHIPSYQDDIDDQSYPSNDVDNSHLLCSQCRAASVSVSIILCARNSRSSCHSSRVNSTSRLLYRSMMRYPSVMMSIYDTLASHKSQTPG
jgi:hypothetical protein